MSWHTPGDYDDYDYYSDERGSDDNWRCVKDRTIERETAMAYLDSEGYWWPKSQSFLDEDGTLIVSEWIWEQKQKEPKKPKPKSADADVEWPF